jgi:hypothetical protein
MNQETFYLKSSITYNIKTKEMEIAGNINKKGLITLIDVFLRNQIGKGTEIPLYILKQVKPRSVLDPFLGSGSYGQASELLGISWLGYEINDIEYRKDIKDTILYSGKSKSSVMHWLKGD